MQCLTYSSALFNQFSLNYLPYLRIPPPARQDYRLKLDLEDGRSAGGRSSQRRDCTAKIVTLVHLLRVAEAVVEKQWIEVYYSDVKHPYATGTNAKSY
jgi:hypothetical protein